MDIVERLRQEAKNFYRANAAEAADEIERLREALKDIDSQMRQADRYLLKESTLAALQQKDSE